MKIEPVPQKTLGLNGVSIASNIILAGVVFGAISPWWLALSIPMLFTGLGMELRNDQRKPTFNI